jgi:hypothetical protein
MIDAAPITETESVIDIRARLHQTVQDTGFAGYDSNHVVHQDTMWRQQLIPEFAKLIENEYNDNSQLSNASALMLCKIFRMFEDLAEPFPQNLIDSVALVAHPPPLPTSTPPITVEPYDPLVHSTDDATETFDNETIPDTDATMTVLETAAAELALNLPEPDVIDTNNDNIINVNDTEPIDDAPMPLAD